MISPAGCAAENARKRAVVRPPRCFNSPLERGTLRQSRHRFSRRLDLIRVDVTQSPDQDEITLRSEARGRREHAGDCFVGPLRPTQNLLAVILISSPLKGRSSGRSQTSPMAIHSCGSSDTRII